MKVNDYEIVGSRSHLYIQAEKKTKQTNIVIRCIMDTWKFVEMLTPPPTTKQKTGMARWCPYYKKSEEVKGWNILPLFGLIFTIIPMILSSIQRAAK